MMKKPRIVSKYKRWVRRRLTEFDQGGEPKPRCNDIFPFDLLVVEEPPNVLVSDDIADVSPSDVEPGKECEAGSVCTEWL
jgi:hypothetical protein